MGLNLVITGDGSHTLFAADLNEHYHSVNGAIQESQHVFIDAALGYHKSKELNILEVGFGTGLNAMLSALESERTKRSIEYYAIEPFPLAQHLIEKLNYCEQLENSTLFDSIHNSKWGAMESLTNTFKLIKKQEHIEDVELNNQFDVVFFDAFAPDVQPELWIISVFEKIYDAMKPGGVFTTYSCKGEVRRNLIKVGFQVEKIPGPVGKREMLRGIKV